MKKIIEESGLSIKEFSELYEIPYNTIRQWANGTRQAPEWVKKLIKKIIELRSKGQEQLKIENIEIFHIIKIENSNRKIYYTNEEEAIKWYEFEKKFNKYPVSYIQAVKIKEIKE